MIWIDQNQLGVRHSPFWLKLESLQVTGAFKARGAMNALLSATIPKAGVCAASAGNHGQAVAWAARELGVPATIFVPTSCPPVKLRRLTSFGATVNVIGEAYEESKEVADEFAAGTGALLIHSYDDPGTVAGSGTVVAEFLEQVPELNTVLLAVGGGGLVAGSLAAAQASSTAIVAVEPSSCRSLGAALDAGAPVDVDVSGPAIDSLGVRRIGDHAFAAVVGRRVPRVEVTDDAIVETQRRVWNELRIGLEGGGATALSALLSGRYEPTGGETVGVVACGGNVDVTALAAQVS